MVVLVLTACPAGLRGHLTRWLMEIAPGVFVGHVTTRVREQLWERTTTLCKDGKALMVYSARNEQHLEFRAHRHDWSTVDFDGLRLMMRPLSPSAERENAMRKGWSKESRRRRAIGRTKQK